MWAPGWWLGGLIPYPYSKDVGVTCAWVSNRTGRSRAVHRVQTAFTRRVPPCIGHDPQEWEGSARHRAPPTSSAGWTAQGPLLGPRASLGRPTGDGGHIQAPVHRLAPLPAPFFAPLGGDGRGGPLLAPVNSAAVGGAARGSLLLGASHLRVPAAEEGAQYRLPVACPTPYRLATRRARPARLRRLGGGGGVAGRREVGAFPPTHERRSSGFRAHPRPRCLGCSGGGGRREGRATNPPPILGPFPSWRPPTRQPVRCRAGGSRHWRGSPATPPPFYWRSPRYRGTPPPPPPAAPPPAVGLRRVAHG